MPHEEEKQVTLKNFLAAKHLKALGIKKSSLFSMLKKIISRACKIRVHAPEPEISRGISKIRITCRACKIRIKCRACKLGITCRACKLRIICRACKLRITCPASNFFKTPLNHTQSSLGPLRGYGFPRKNTGTACELCEHAVRHFLRSEPGSSALRRIF